MKEEVIFIEHAENHGERKVELTKEDGLSYLKKVDGYREYTDPETNQKVKVLCEYLRVFLSFLSSLLRRRTTSSSEVRYL